jgi:hypothetical protein
MGALEIEADVLSPTMSNANIYEEFDSIDSYRYRCRIRMRIMLVARSRVAKRHLAILIASEGTAGGI